MERASGGRAGEGGRRRTRRKSAKAEINRGRQKHRHLQSHMLNVDLLRYSSMLGSG